MPFIIKILGAGATIANAKTGLYTATPAPPGLGAIVQNVRLVNTAAASGTVNLFFKPNGGSQIRILGKHKPVVAGDILVVKPELTIGPSDAIEVTTSQVMDFVVSGVEKV